MRDEITVILEAIEHACDNGRDESDLPDAYVSSYAIGVVVQEIVSDDIVLDRNCGYVGHALRMRLDEGKPAFTADELLPALQEALSIFVNG